MEIRAPKVQGSDIVSEAKMNVAKYEKKVDHVEEKIILASIWSHRVDARKQIYGVFISRNENSR